MASKNNKLALADALLSKSNIGITAEIVDRHIDAALKAGEKARLAELFDVQKLVKAVQSDA